MLSCIYGGECRGCVSCSDCTRYVVLETQEDKDAAIDRAYDKLEEKHGNA